ncbi:MAG: prepilin-type N-terminal cleavage/methylation domain-containing protein [Planctomycetes bacterium]|nr:prepilin-type N-terminal cleavage/methylation domain-containing protein [Planctomycetota bacterium]
MLRKAFTLIELLVVIAIIALLMGILLPTLSRVKRHAAGSACLANHRSLATAWVMYADENDGYLVPTQVVSGQRTAWVQVPQDEAGHPTAAQTTACTLDDKTRGIERGLIFPYVKSRKVFLCPADRRLTIGIEDCRSYSMIGCLNGQLPGSAYYKYQIRKYSQIKSPGEKYMLVEEADSRGFNSTWWTLATREMGYDPVQWWSPLAIWHGDSSTLGFCDGHAESHRWREELTRQLAQKTVLPGQNYGITKVPDGRRTDVDYMDYGWAYKFGQK